jgi:hypothetical protein
MGRKTTDVSPRGVRKRAAYWRDKEKNASKRLDARLQRRYGITKAEYDKQLAKQGGVCAICKGPEGGGRLMCVDHDHAHCPGLPACAMCVRGLLCKTCNLLLGAAKDRCTVLRAAIAYLAFWGPWCT